MTTLYAYGVTPASAKDATQCVVSDVNSVCSQYISDTTVQNEFTTSCVGTSTCTISTSSIWSTTASSDCGSNNAYFFAQYSCTQSNEVLAWKHNWGALTACTTVLSGFLFLLTLMYLKENGRLKQIEWDVSTITAGDYTVEYEISADMF
jgi:hypothetical protein